MVSHILSLRPMYVLYKGTWTLWGDVVARFRVLATVNILDTRATVRMDMGFYMGMILWTFLESSYRIHVLLILTLAHVRTGKTLPGSLGCTWLYPSKRSGLEIVNSL